MDNNIRQIRQERGLTLQEVAASVKCSIPYLTDLEHGRRGAKPDTLQRIADALGTTVEELKGGGDDDKLPDHS